MAYVPGLKFGQVQNLREVTVSWMLEHVSTVLSPMCLILMFIEKGLVLTQCKHRMQMQTS